MLLMPEVQFGLWLVCFSSSSSKFFFLSLRKQKTFKQHLSFNSYEFCLWNKKKLCLGTILFIQNTNGNILSIFLLMPKQILLVFHQTLRHFWYSGNQNTLTVINCLLVSETLLEIFLRFVLVCYIWKWWTDLRLLPIVIHFY